MISIGFASANRKKKKGRKFHHVPQLARLERRRRRRWTFTATRLFRNRTPSASVGMLVRIDIRIFSAFTFVFSGRSKKKSNDDKDGGHLVHLLMSHSLHTLRQSGRINLISRGTVSGFVSFQSCFHGRIRFVFVSHRLAK